MVSPGARGDVPCGREKTSRKRPGPYSMSRDYSCPPAGHSDESYLTYTVSVTWSPSVPVSRCLSPTSEPRDLGSRRGPREEGPLRVQQGRRLEQPSRGPLFPQTLSLPLFWTVGIGPTSPLEFPALPVRNTSGPVGTRRSTENLILFGRYPPTRVDPLSPRLRSVTVPRFDTGDRVYDRDSTLSVRRRTPR